MTELEAIRALVMEGRSVSNRDAAYLIGYIDGLKKVIADVPPPAKHGRRAQTETKVPDVRQ